MTTISFKTIKIDKDDLVLLKYREINGKASAKCEKEPDQPAHPDLLAAMAKLTPHFALLCEEIEAPVNITQVGEEILEPFHVRGFHRGTNEEMPGVTIVGHKILKSGKVLGLNAPFTRFKEDAGEEGAYPFQEHLEGILAEIEVEAEEYLLGKFRPDPQQELPFDIEDNGDTSKTVLNVLDPKEGSPFEGEGPKKRGRKKKAEPVEE